MTKMFKMYLKQFNLASSSLKNLYKQKEKFVSAFSSSFCSASFPPNMYFNALTKKQFLPSSSKFFYFYSLYNQINFSFPFFISSSLFPASHFFFCSSTPTLPSSTWKAEEFEKVFSIVMKAYTSKEKILLELDWHQECEKINKSLENLKVEEIFFILSKFIQMHNLNFKVCKTQILNLINQIRRNENYVFHKNHIFLLLESLRFLPLQIKSKKECFDWFSEKIKGDLLNFSNRELCDFLDHLSALSIYGIKSEYLFFLNHQILIDRMENEDKLFTPYDLIIALKAFSKSNVNLDMRVLYEYIYKQSGEGYRTINSKIAIHLLYTLIYTKYYSAPIIEQLLCISSKVGVHLWLDRSVELRSLKLIEIEIRLLMCRTLASLSNESISYLNSIRDARYFDPSIHHNTILSYQVKHFLSKHNFPCNRRMLGPYALKICDFENQIAFECIELTNYFKSTKILKLSMQKKLQHLKLLGWKVFTISHFEWKALINYERKASFVHKLLSKNKLIFHKN